MPQAPEAPPEIVTPAMPTEPVNTAGDPPVRDQALFSKTNPTAEDVVAIQEHMRLENEHNQALRTYAQAKERHRRDLALYNQAMAELSRLQEQRQAVIDIRNASHQREMQRHEKYQASRTHYLDAGWVEAPNFDGAVGDPVANYDATDGYRRLPQEEAGG